MLVVFGLARLYERTGSDAWPASNWHLPTRSTQPREPNMFLVFSCYFSFTYHLHSDRNFSFFMYQARKKLQKKDYIEAFGVRYRSIQ